MNPLFPCVLAGLLALGCPDETEPRGAPPLPMQEAPQEAAREVLEAPPRQPVAGLRGVELRSRLVFEGAAVEQDLEFACVFPERARLCTRARGPHNQRFILYRFGDATFGLQPGESTSEAYTGAAHTHTVRHLELRRALALWPDGFAWHAEDAEGAGGAVRVADLGPHGRLRAELGGDGRPLRLEALDAEGSAVEAFEGLTWREGAHGRTWPAEARLVQGGRVVFRETYAAVETGLFVVDGFFLPPDRRPATRRAVGIVAIDLEPHTERRRELTARDLSGALHEIEELRRAEATELARGPHRLAADQVLALDEDGRPRAVILRLEEPVTAAPSGWARAPGRTAVSQRLESPAALGPGTRRRLAEACPADARPVEWYVRLNAEDALGGPCQAVLALGPRDG